jgi:hypothetical protein
MSRAQTSAEDKALHSPDIDDRIERLWQGAGLTARPRVILVPWRRPEEAPVLWTCFEPTDLAETAAAAVLTDDAGWRELARPGSSCSRLMLPIVDATGRAKAIADAAFSATDITSWLGVADAIRRFAARRALVVPAVPELDDSEWRLLCRLFVAQTVLAAVHDPANRAWVRYPGPFEPAVHRTAERLARRGLLSRRFFDRLHVCAGCDSRRLSAREQCAACGSAQLSEQPLLHHFACATLAPEADFRSGSHLVCPKCRSYLRHYGSDYDKPGQSTVCIDCGASGEPHVAFLCLDCGARTGADDAKVVDTFSYRLSDAGTALLTSGEGLGLLDLPEDVAAEVVSRRTPAGEPAPSVCAISYGARDRLVAEGGESRFERLRRQFADTLSAALGAEGSVISTRETDYVVLRSELDLGAVLAAAGTTLAADLAPQVTAQVGNKRP